MSTFRERQITEPIGRWENRCPITYPITYGIVAICDRPREHQGLHTGRLWHSVDSSKAAVVGYVRW